MKLHTYSSLAAFLAHHSALRAEAAGSGDGTRLNPDDAATLREMERLIDDLGPADREALHDLTAYSIPPGSAARHRARAELKLHRILAARAILAG